MERDSFDYGHTFLTLVLACVIHARKHPLKGVLEPRGTDRAVITVVLTPAVEFIKKKNGIEGKIEYMQLISFRSELISAIRRYYTLLCIENDDSLQARLSNPQDE